MTHIPNSRRRARPIKSLTAAAKRVTASRIGRSTHSGRDGGERAWQDGAWRAYEQVGELRYAAQHVARGLSRSTLGAARDPAGADDPTIIDLHADDIADPWRPIDRAAADLVADLGGGSAGLASLLQRVGVLLFIPGEAYIVGLSDDPDDRDAPTGWIVASPDEITTSRDGQVTLDLGDGSHEYDPDDVLITRVWNPHPRRWWHADSATRSALPILNELIGLTAHVDAAVESRLAGAGILVVPNSVTFAGDVDDDGDTEDAFVDALIEAMVTPIKDRDSAAAVVPLVIRVPDEVAANGGVQHLTFSTPLDAQAQALRDEAIRRLAMALDVPAEVLTGMGDVNHWSMWGISESTVIGHVEPMLAQIADALTVGYLRPALEALGYPVADVDEMVVWFDTSNLILRPNRSADAKDAFDRGAITSDALRTALGFDAGDAPDVGDTGDPAVQAVLALVTAAPSLAQDPGMPALLGQVRDLLAGQEGVDTDVAEAVAIAEVEQDVADVEPGDVAGAVPDTNGDPSLAAALGLLPS